MTRLSAPGGVKPMKTELLLIHNALLHAWLCFLVLVVVCSLIMEGCEMHHDFNLEILMMHAFQNLRPVDFALEYCFWLRPRCAVTIPPPAGRDHFCSDFVPF